jgi:hypothetical protein
MAGYKKKISEVDFGSICFEWTIFFLCRTTFNQKKEEKNINGNELHARSLLKNFRLKLLSICCVVFLFKSFTVL